jgi:HD-GYP domain-containing protein (c-di-GMP phosphodiesterase class II)
MQNARCHYHRGSVGAPFHIPADLVIEGESAAEQLARLRDLVHGCDHDGYALCNHAADVADLSTRFARYLGCDDRTTETIEAAAWCHDLGKLFLPLSVILWDGRLSPEQRAEFNRHPAEGAALFTHPELRTIALAVRCHHESPSGCGYPDGLPREQIPPEARLIGVTDWYAACRERRIYKAEKPHSVAMGLTWAAAAEGKIDAELTAELQTMLDRDAWNPCSAAGATSERQYRVTLPQ